MDGRWPIGVRAEGGRACNDSHRACGRWLQPLPQRRPVRQDDRSGFDGLDQAGRPGADRERSRLRAQRRLRRADQGRQGFQPTLAEPRDRRARLRDPARAGLRLRGRANLPRFPGKLRQWQNRELVAGFGLPRHQWQMGYPYAQAVAAELTVFCLAFRLLEEGTAAATQVARPTRCKNTTRTPDETESGQAAFGLWLIFPEGDVTDARPL